MSDYAIIDHARNDTDEVFLPVGVIIGREGGAWEFRYLPSDLAIASRGHVVGAVASRQAYILEPDDWGRAFVRIARSGISGGLSLPVVIGLPEGTGLDELFRHYVYTYHLPADLFPGAFIPALDPPFG